MTKKKIVHHQTKIKNKKSKYSNFLAPLIILGIISLATIIWYSWPRPTPVSINLVGSETGTVDLALTPATLSLSPNTETTLTMTYASTQHLSFIQAELTYDPSLIEPLLVTPGSDFPTTVTASKIENGKITFVYGIAVAEGSQGLLGTGTVATIKLKSLVPGNATLSFTDQTITTATENTGAINTLKSAGSATLTIAEAVASVAPSVEPSAIASAEPSASPSVSPSTPASAEPSSTASPQKPAKPTGLQSNCFDGGNKITLRWDAVTGANSYKLRMDQKDGNSDKSIDGITKTNYEFNVIPDQKYSWWVHTTKDGLDSEEARINEVVCTKTIASATATPTPKPTVKPTIKPTPKPTARPTSTPITPTPRPSTATTAYVPPSQRPYTCPELCGDGTCNITCGESFQNCKADCTINDYSTGANTNEIAIAPTTFWQKILNWLSNLFTPTQN